MTLGHSSQPEEVPDPRRISNRFEETYRSQYEPVPQNRSGYIPCRSQYAEALSSIVNPFASVLSGQSEPVMPPPTRNSNETHSNPWSDLNQDAPVLPDPTGQFPQRPINRGIPVPAFLQDSPERVSARRRNQVDPFNPMYSPPRRTNQFEPVYPSLQNPFASESPPPPPPPSTFNVSRGGDQIWNEGRSTGYGFGISRQNSSYSSSEGDDDNPYRRLAKKPLKSSRNYYDQVIFIKRSKLRYSYYRGIQILWGSK